MKKIISFVLVFLVIGFAVLAIHRINKEDNKLEKITVADATITSLTLTVI